MVVFHWPSGFFRRSEFCLQKIFVIVCLKIFHVAAFGLCCFGQVSVDVKDGFFWPVRGYFRRLFPSKDVISDRVRI